jgi:hypothetical protein
VIFIYRKFNKEERIAIQLTGEEPHCRSYQNCSKDSRTCGGGRTVEMGMSNSAATVENNIPIVKILHVQCFNRVSFAGSRCGEGHSRPYRALRHWVDTLFIFCHLKEERTTLETAFRPERNLCNDLKLASSIHSTTFKHN